MDDLMIKNVDVFGDSIMAVKDKDGNIWAGVSYFCRALGMDKKQKDNQVERVQQDDVLKRGAGKFPAGVFDPANEAVALRIDFVPIWLTKIRITPKMKNERPELAEKLLNYQLKAKDILADAFLPNREPEQTQVCNPSEIQLGELASYLKIMDKVANRQNLASYKIAENFKRVSEQFGVQLSDDFVNVPEYVQQTLKLDGGAAK